MVWSLRLAARYCNQIFSENKFDLVHVQGDFASASLGLTLARQRGIPLVYTSHTNIDVGADKLLGKPLKILLMKFSTWQFAHFLKIPNRPKVRDAWGYMAFAHQFANLVIAPSNHFAKLLREKKVAENPEVIITGVDDDELTSVERTTPVPQKPVHFVWAGRMLPEKRLIQAIEAFAKAKTNATLGIYGFGPLEKVARNLVQARGLSKRVKFQGKLEHREILQVFADADVVLQTSIGFETQGLTVYEAAAVGTPTLLCDPKIAEEMPGDTYWVDRGGNIESLSKTIRRATKEIQDGHTKRENLANTDWLHQSEISKRMIAIYSQLIEQRVSAR